MTAKTPWHLWIVGVIAVAWNGFGCLDYVMTNMQNPDWLQHFTEEQRAYFASFPTWFTVIWAIGVWGSLAGSILLLLRSKWAATLFLASLAAMVVAGVWSMFFAPNRPTMTMVEWIMWPILYVFAICFWLYARRLAAGGVLR